MSHSNVDISATKPQKKRSSDLNLDKALWQYLMGMLAWFGDLLGLPAVTTVKMDGAQVSFLCDGSKIWDISSHHGNIIGNDVIYASPDDFGNPLNFQRVDLSKHFRERFASYCRLVALLKSTRPDVQTIRIYTEMMVPVSPLRINYSAEISNSVFVFEMITNTGESIRVDESIAELLTSLNLTPVPFLSVGTFTAEYLRDLRKFLLKTPNVEGLILYLPTVNKAFKIKPGRYHTSSFAKRIDESMYLVPHFGEMAKALVELINSTSDKVPGKKRLPKKAKKGKNSQPVIDDLMRKEMSHTDWVKQFKLISKKKYGEFFQKFANHIVDKLEIENPDLLSTIGRAGCEKYVKGKTFGMFRIFAKA